jgi:hypothetical protein
MIAREGCMWRARWKADIGPIHPKTPEGRRAPLRVVDVARGWPEELAAYEPERLTPSSIPLRDGVETGRIRGYPGEDLFWGPLAGTLCPERASGGAAAGLPTDCAPSTGRQAAPGESHLRVGAGVGP